VRLCEQGATERAEKGLAVVDTGQAGQVNKLPKLKTKKNEGPGSNKQDSNMRPVEM